MRSANYTARFPDTIECGLKAWVDGYLVVNFDYERADLSVGIGESASVNSVHFESENGERIIRCDYNPELIEEACLEWIANERANEIAAREEGV